MRELSREESDVIADRVVAAFSRERGLTASIADRLELVVAQSLYAYFVAHTIDARALPGALRRDVADTVETAARDLLGLDSARALSAALLADLGSAG